MNGGETPTNDTTSAPSPATLGVLAALDAHVSFIARYVVVLSMIVSLLVWANASIRTWVSGAFGKFVVGVIDVQLDSEGTGLGDLRDRLVLLETVPGELSALDERVSRVEGLEVGTRTTLQNAVIVTDVACSRLGNGWEPQDGAAGRFVVAAGVGTDIAGTEMIFQIDGEDREGEYRHVLSTDEMPRYSRLSSRGTPCPVPDDCIDHGDQFSIDSLGEGAAHNNIPPYFVLNFCKRR